MKNNKVKTGFIFRALFMKISNADMKTPMRRPITKHTENMSKSVFQYFSKYSEFIVPQRQPAKKKIIGNVEYEKIELKMIFLLFISF